MISFPESPDSREHGPTCADPYKHILDGVDSSNKVGSGGKYIVFGWPHFIQLIKILKEGIKVGILGSSRITKSLLVLH